ncbi:non-homologous end-joining factor 1 isoform X2 [Salarias fasciatus]|uniref:non-homologous end-joining factor 1 isoform X2 n=1 Tax=Salarias fasciatus TaxID=181472 RepID=UPI0011770907|nr:non-homologous end-joining factor 1 isoform X2 [Salarias fasciatus]
MEAGGSLAGDVLLGQPWIPVSVSGCQLLAKSWFGETTYHILLSDLHSVWEERMDAEAIQIRAKDLNKRLQAPVKAFFSYLYEVVQPFLSGDNSGADSKAQISLTKQEGGNISIGLKSKLEGLPFHWEFHCIPAPVTLVCVQLVRPLLAMSRLLQQQVDQLGGLLVRKDAEILDYKENGATLTRERLQTDVFEEHTFRQDFMAKALPLLCAERPDVLGFDADLQRLYGAVVTHRTARKRKLPEERVVEELQTEGAALSSSPAKSVGVDTAGDDRKQSHNGQVDEAEAKTASKQTVPQSLAVSSEPAERPSTKSKKKKKVGLFR